ncbi:MAG: hypothetical protein KTR31_09775 [Myxococcales bacterium]|nr:hypothetical protein [Myxococcales bacterium]
MNLIDILTAFFGRSAEQTQDEVPDGLCPNCWGHDEYDGQIRQRMKDRQINVNNGQERYAFIRDFAVTHVDGIRLRNHDSRNHCPTCKANYG